jgi:hypothetical protein
VPFSEALDTVATTMLWPAMRFGPGAEGTERLPPCEICVGCLPMEVCAVEDRETGWETPGQWPSTAESAVMILHSFRAGSSVVTDTGCCPSAARRVPTPTLGTTI